MDFSQPNNRAHVRTKMCPFSRLLGETAAKAFLFKGGAGREKDNFGSLSKCVYPTTTNELTTGQLKSELPVNQSCSMSTREKSRCEW